MTPACSVVSAARRRVGGGRTGQAAAVCGLGVGWVWWGVVWVALEGFGNPAAPGCLVPPSIKFLRPESGGLSTFLLYLAIETSAP